MVRSHDGDTDFYIIAKVLQGNALAPYMITYYESKQIK